MATVSEVRERPINLRDWEVRALLDGRKTQVCIPIKLPRWARGREIEIDEFGLPCAYSSASKTHLWMRCPFAKIKVIEGGAFIRPHYECDGTRMWVQEAFAGPFRNAGSQATYRYRATDFKSDIRFRGNWHGAHSMHRVASRITLEAVAVRAHRIKDISHREALAEGVRYDVSKPRGAPLAMFERAWIKRHGADSWDANPWVWAISFKRLENHHAS